MNFSFERPAGACFGDSDGPGCVPDAASEETWASCPTWGCGSVDIGPNPGGSINMGQVQPTDGDYYISMECSGPGGLGEGFSLQFCPGVTLLAGEEYCLSMDLITWTTDGFICPPFSFNGCPGNSSLVIYGSASPCEMSQTLWTSPTLSGTWTNYGFCFTPTGNWSVLNFRVINPTSGLSAVAIDDMVLTQPADYFTQDCELLSVTWLDVVAHCVDAGRIVRWVATSEDADHQYHVQRSTDLVTWITVGTVPGSGAGGEVASYEFLDTTMDHPDTGAEQFYRVRWTGGEGSAHRYSHAVPSQCTFRIFPNPADDHIVVRVGQPDVDVRVVDALGRLVRTQRIEGLEGRILVDDLAAGYYAVQVQRTGALLAHGVFIKR